MFSNFFAYLYTYSHLNQIFLCTFVMQVPPLWSLFSLYSKPLPLFSKYKKHFEFIFNIKINQNCRRLCFILVFSKQVWYYFYSVFHYSMLQRFRAREKESRKTRFLQRKGVTSYFCCRKTRRYQLKIFGHLLKSLSFFKFSSNMIHFKQMFIDWWFFMGKITTNN